MKIQLNGMTVNTAVSPEFPEGLHRKYLEFIAQGLGLTLRIEGLPYARRIADLRTGELDILVGVQQGRDSDPDLVYMHPSYEDLHHTLFIRNDKQEFWNKSSSLAGKILAVTINARYFDAIYQAPSPTLVQVSTVKQKVELLLLNRVDGFFHYQDSTLPLLKKMQIEHRIIAADYQPSTSKLYYVTISRHSPLMDFRTDIEAFINKSVKQNDFANIREKHYEDLQKQIVKNNIEKNHPSK